MVFLGGFQDSLHKMFVFHRLFAFARNHSLGPGNQDLGLVDDTFDLFFRMMDAKRSQLVVSLVQLRGFHGQPKIHFCIFHLVQIGIEVATYAKGRNGQCKRIVKFVQFRNNFRGKVLYLKNNGHCGGVIAEDPVGNLEFYMKGILVGLKDDHVCRLKNLRVVEFLHIQNLAAVLVDETLGLQQISDDGLTTTESPNMLVFSFQKIGVDNQELLLQCLLERNSIRCGFFFYNLFCRGFLFLGQTLCQFGFSKLRENHSDSPYDNNQYDDNGNYVFQILHLTGKYNYIGSMPILFALVGATGIGKSNLSMDLADHYDAEIIGVDSRQIYKGFSIGTAQPSQDCIQRVKHHLVDFLEPTETFSAGEFCRQVKELVSANPQKNYILVGGTGLYIQSLMLGLPNIPPIPESIRKDLEQTIGRFGAEALYKEACSMDPEAMAKVEPNNVQRICRILEVYRATGRKLSDLQKEREGGVGLLPIFWLQRNRDNLYKRIDQRVDQMIKDGWIDEAKSLAKSVPLDAPAWQSLGYRELLYAQSHSDIELTVEDVKKKTRNYAKRQLTWFRWQVESVAVDLEGKNSPFQQIVSAVSP
mgnify:CR=1 FL=1